MKNAPNILCLSLVLYGIRIGGFHTRKGPIYKGRHPCTERIYKGCLCLSLCHKELLGTPGTCPRHGVDQPGYYKLKPSESQVMNYIWVELLNTCGSDCIMGRYSHSFCTLQGNVKPFIIKIQNRPQVFWVILKKIINLYGDFVFCMGVFFSQFLQPLPLSLVIRKNRCFMF